MSASRPATSPSPAGRVCSCRVTVPTLVFDSAGSSDELIGMAAAVAQAMANGFSRSLPGEWHGDDAILAPALTEFLVLRAEQLQRSRPVSYA